MNTPDGVTNDEFLRDDWLRQRRFTSHARMMLQHAYHRALDRGIYGALPAVVMLWAMVRWERKLGIVVLETCGVDLKRLEQDIEDALNACPQRAWRDGVDCSRIRDVAVLAVKEATALGHDHVGTEHFVLAMCRMNDQEIARLFTKHGISHEHCQQSLFKLLKPGDCAND